MSDILVTYNYTIINYTNLYLTFSVTTELPHNDKKKTKPIMTTLGINIKHQFLKWHSEYDINKCAVVCGA